MVRFDVAEQPLGSGFYHVEDPREAVARPVIGVRHVRDAGFGRIIHEQAQTVEMGGGTASTQAVRVA